MKQAACFSGRTPLARPPTPLSGETRSRHIHTPAARSHTKLARRFRFIHYLEWHENTRAHYGGPTHCRRGPPIFNNHIASALIFCGRLAVGGPHAWSRRQAICLTRVTRRLHTLAFSRAKVVQPQSRRSLKLKIFRKLSCFSCQSIFRLQPPQTDFFLGSSRIVLIRTIL